MVIFGSTKSETKEFYSININNYRQVKHLVHFNGFLIGKSVVYSIIKILFIVSNMYKVRFIIFILNHEMNPFF